MDAIRDFFADIDWSRWAETTWTTSGRVLIIVIALYIALKLAQRAIGPAIRAAVSAEMGPAHDRDLQTRVETLSSVAYRTIWIIAILIGLITILPEFGINASALIAGAGIVGIAVGFGAQSLVKDIIGGVFVIVENQFGRGDIVELNGIVGEVMDVNLRRTVLRDLDGTVHSIPHSVPPTTSNMTRTFSRLNMHIGVSYSEDLDHVYEVINRVGREMAEDPEWKSRIKSPPAVLGLDEFGDSGLSIRVLGDTQPIEQWPVMREFRKRIKKAFDEEGIEIPFPHRTLVTEGQKAADGFAIKPEQGQRPTV